VSEQLEIETLKRENARLDAEVEKWEKNTQLMGRQLNDELEQVARLKAEVERLQSVINEARDYLGNCTTLETAGKNAYSLVWLNSKGAKP